MKVLVVGSGGREHAIIWSLCKNKKIDKIYAISGNAGISELAECVNINPCDIEKVCSFAIENKIDFTVVAPDDPLALGLVNELEKRGLKAFGPRKEAAIIEASKAFSKDLMKKYNIPTADYETFDNYEKAVEYLKKSKMPIVLKADGLALGKGVLICDNFEQATEGLKQIMIDSAFGDAGKKVVIEEFLTGEEVSVLTFTDGETVVPMITSCDHKRALDNDKGLNTGGMGTFSPCPFYSKKIEKEVYDNILMPTIKAMNKENRKFKGVLYFGLMRTKDGMKVIEYNARFGDPETQVVLPMLKTDLLEIFEAVADERLKDINIEWEQGACVCVMLASGGYPKAYEKGKEITITDLDKEIMLFHSGTKYENGILKTNGGRVLGVTAKADTIIQARETVYKNIEKIKFEGMHFRKDIGIKYQ